MAPGNLYRHTAVAQTPAYGALAPLYDRLMSHVGYDEWRDLIGRVFAKYSEVERPRILEIGAGTGTLGTLLQKQGHAYVGSDAAFAMCREAIKKNVPFFCADSRSLPVKPSFDFIIFLYDAINYLLLTSDWEQLFHEIERVLTPGGLFLFDITTETNSLARFFDYTDFEDFGAIACIRHSYYDRLNKLQHNDFTIFSESAQQPGLYTKQCEHHVQKIMPIEKIKALIPTNYFTIEGVWDGYGFKPATQASERIHFLLRKKEVA
jgi:SAM-dependent methyltransferase